MIEISNILPEDLKSSFDSIDYEEEGGLVAQSLNYFDHELHFTFSIFLGDINQNQTQCWKLQVLNYRDSKIDVDNMGGYFRFYCDHFLLSEFTDTKTELYFKKRALNPEKLLAAIYKIHNSVFGNYISLEKFINGGDLLNLCQANNGIFAHGPKHVLRYYYDVLQKAGAEPYYYGDFPAKNRNGEKWTLEENNLKLALLGGTYFIGTDFNFIQLNKING